MPMLWATFHVMMVSPGPWIAVYKSIPEEWQTELIVPVWKRKGYIHAPGKYRDKLLSHILKVFVTDFGVCVCKVPQARGGPYAI